MGGRGSGGHNSKRKLRDVQCARFDVHEMARDGKLTLGKRGRLFGTTWFEVAGGPDAQRLVLVISVKVGQRRAAGSCRQLSTATGDRHTMAGATSCSCAANVAAPRASAMLDVRITITVSGFSPAPNARGLLVSQRWATGGIALLVA